jgi:hypothetical protein
VLRKGDPVEPEMIFAEAQLKSASGEVRRAPNVQPLILKKRLTVSTVVLVAVSVVLLIVAYTAVLITIARIVTAAASPG